MSESVSLLSDHISPAQLADELGITVRTLDRWRAFGTAPPVTKIGKRVYYRRNAIAEWLKSREQKPAQATA